MHHPSSPLQQCHAWMLFRLAVLCLIGWRALVLWGRFLWDGEKLASPSQTIARLPSIVACKWSLINYWSLIIASTQERTYLLQLFIQLLLSSLQFTALAVYKACTNHLHSYLSSIVTPCSSVKGRSSLRSASDGKYVVPGTRLVFGRRSFTVTRPCIWNSLPPHVCNSITETIFRSKLKTHLFSSIYGF